jgi:ATP-dependent exoDNAse (exonuclease V) beta subunit
VETQKSIEFNWAGEDARLTGNLVHRILQLIGEQGLEHFSGPEAFGKVAPWCRQQLTCEGVNPSRGEVIMTRISEAINNSLASEKGRWLLEDHEDARCEYAITTVVGSLNEENREAGGPNRLQAKNLVLDRTFVDGDTRWIVDYKTSIHGGGDKEGFLDNEAERYREQLQSYKKAMALTETRPIKTALYFPMFDRFLEVD